MNPTNLARLATKLESLDRDYRHFEMDAFLRDADETSNVDFDDLEYDDATADRLFQYITKNGGVDAIGADLGCKTVACAIGHGPSAGILMTDRFLHNDRSVDWMRYTEEMFIGSEPYVANSRRRYQPLFAWMFGHEWSHTDNSPWGAAARIRYVLHHGAPPTEFVENENYDPTPDLYAEFMISEKQPLPAGFYPA